MIQMFYRCKVFDPLTDLQAILLSRLDDFRKSTILYKGGDKL